MDVKPGIYKHYKGKYYQVIGVAKHSETLEEFVTYYCLYPNIKGQLWIRPQKMFQEKIKINGKIISRFRLIRDPEKELI